MYWNYRVTRRHFDEEELLEIREVYYEDDGKIANWTLDPMRPHGETLEELQDDLAHMREALSREVLEFDKLDQEGVTG